MPDYASLLYFSVTRGTEIRLALLYMRMHRQSFTCAI